MVTAIILAAGSGSRAQSEIPKQFADLAGRPVLAWSLAAFQKSPRVDAIIVVAAQPYFSEVDKIVKDYSITKFKALTEGGARRQDSSRNALSAMVFGDDDILLFHDAARPMLSQSTIANCIDSVAHTGAAASVIPSADTIYVCEKGDLVKIPDRNKIYCAQTPQAFTFSIIKQAHDKADADGITVTDEISLVHSLGKPVKLFAGDHFAMKITEPEDFVRAAALAESCFPFPSK